MRDIHELRHALKAETTDLAVHISPDLVRHRARRIRIRQRTVAAAAVVAVAAGAVTTVTLASGASPAFEVAGPPPASTPPCPSPQVGPTGEVNDVGQLVDTGAVLDAANTNTRYDVLIGLVGTREPHSFVVAFRNQKTGTVDMWDTTLVSRDRNGDLPGKRTGDPSRQFFSSQLALGPDEVLDVGFYTRTAHRITVTSEGDTTDAATSRDTATGWTLFWAQRRATPLPPERHTVPEFYQGPEQVTLTAYDADGRPQHTVTGGPGVGGSVHNPRDASPVGPTSPPATPDPTCPSPGAPR
ncbi:hypothetical protein [Micromonospora sp. HM5-17]|uniref:hypothetical protein n=1 Tax=Micromonospora sp. HM5-17 TaxID=2487710 RepID=UPI0011CD3C25|nr:hypothetical protein [Micromonospora sp. HM5-17]